MKKIRIDGAVLDIMSMPEVQEILSKFEGRISYIENSMPLQSDDIKEQLRELSERVNLIKKPYLTAKQNDTINQLRLDREHFWEKFNILKGKVNELFKSRKTKGSKEDSYIYSSISKSKGEANDL